MYFCCPRRNLPKNRGNACSVLTSSARVEWPHKFGPGRVVINGMTDDPQAPWGGFKYSGFGREYGQYGIEAFLETRAILES